MFISFLSLLSNGRGNRAFLCCQGNVVKAALQELEVIKERCRGNQATLDRLQRKVEQAKTRVPQDLRPRVSLSMSVRDWSVWVRGLSVSVRDWSVWVRDLSEWVRDWSVWGERSVSVGQGLVSVG